MQVQCVTMLGAAQVRIRRHCGGTKPSSLLISAASSPRPCCQLGARTASRSRRTSWPGGAAELHFDEARACATPEKHSSRRAVLGALACASQLAARLGAAPCAHAALPWWLTFASGKPRLRKQTAEETRAFGGAMDALFSDSGSYRPDRHVRLQVQRCQHMHSPLPRRAMLDCRETPQREAPVMVMCRVCLRLGCYVMLLWIRFAPADTWHQKPSADADTHTAAPRIP